MELNETNKLDFIEMAMEGVLESLTEQEIKELVQCPVVGIA
tara:strand:+ start:264 stop:386 length:123 start_codon:yes stop_codon:yes gene_type:complete